MGNVIKIGAVGALRNYTLRQQGDGLAWSRGPANPFAAKVNTSNLYDNVDAWNEYVQEDWQTGVGRVDPEEGGFLYAELDSRVPKQLILAQAIDVYGNIPQDLEVGSYSAWFFGPYQYDQSYTTRTVSQGNYISWRIHSEVTDSTPTTINISSVWVYGECADGTVLRADIYSNSSGPSSSLANASVTVTNDYPGPQWHKVPVTKTGLADATVYWVVVRPTTGTITLHGVGLRSSNMILYTSANGTDWTILSSFNPYFKIDALPGSAANDICYGIKKFAYGGPDSLVVIGRQYNGDNAVVYQRNIADSRYLDHTYTFSGGGAGVNATDAAAFDSNLYVARGSSYAMVSIPIDLTLTPTSWTVSATKLLSFGGYLWRSLNNNLYYSSSPVSDGSGWTTVGKVCGDSFQIRSMAGMNGDVYLGCDDGLYRCAPGDFIEGIVPWQISQFNGRSMCSYGGALYVVVHGRVWRYGQEGSWRDVWVSRDDDLPANRLGEVIEVISTDIGVAALVNSGSGGRSSVWMYQDEGWHHLATLPTTSGSTMFYERTTYRLWVGTSDGQMFGVYMPVNALNPYNDTSSRYMPAGWLEQDRFYGGQYLLDKDFESVTIVGDNLSANVNVKVYWQDEGSTAWELLGTADSDGEELRWSNHTTRPQGKWVKLGLLLSTNDADETPRVRAVVLKFLPMVNDRIRDSVTITLKNYIQMPDGAPDTYTLAQQLAHIQSMVERVIPFIYEDPLGVQYEARITDYQMKIDQFGHENGANVNKEMEVTLVIEQVPDSTYTA
jgi:hypothetical protein